MNLNVLDGESKLGNSGLSVGHDEEDVVGHSVIPKSGFSDRLIRLFRAQIQSFFVFAEEKTRRSSNRAGIVL